MNNIQEIRLNKEEIGLDTIDQSYLIIHEREKFKYLSHFIKSRDNRQTIVFSATKQRTQRLAVQLKQEGFKAITIHGDLSQKQRDRAMYRFKSGREDILVATDIAARGIDVLAVGHVINYDIPEDPLIYFHRIGRTARAGGTGKAISLVSHNRIEDFERILRHTLHPIRKLNEEMGVELPKAQYRFIGGYPQIVKQNNNNPYRGKGRYGYYGGWEKRYNHSRRKPSNIWNYDL
jgi:ATP-dependent RNA helicase DeaD